MTAVVIGELALTGSDYLFKCAFHLPIFKSFTAQGTYSTNYTKKYKFKVFD